MPTSSSEKPPLRVLFTASEADPLIKVGGLGDVTGSLPRALAADPSLEVRLVIPFHHAIHAKVSDPELMAEFRVPRPSGSVGARGYRAVVDGLPVYLISGAPFRKGEGVYSLNTEEDGEKYTFFSLAVLEFARAMKWKPDVLHAHDWHTALSTRMLAAYRSTDRFFARTRSLLTIHNLPFMGAGTDHAMQHYGIPPVSDPRMPDWGAYQPLPMGLSTADYLSTVSPGYAQEIQTPEYGNGLEGLLQQRSAELTGILNGLDEAAYDPSTDETMPANFDRTSLDKRLANKSALLREAGLPVNLDLPLFVLVSRMDYQKGVDLALEALREIENLPWQAVLLGTGDPALEEAMEALETAYPYRVKAVPRFDAALARRMYGGGDMLLMPSRYEPCGTAQMIAMRYGCLPVARATGGLRDTILDQPRPEHSTGFLFEEASAHALAGALRRAMNAYQDTAGWRARQEFAMQQDFSWRRSAQAYADLYQKLGRMRRARANRGGADSSS